MKTSLLVSFLVALIASAVAAPLRAAPQLKFKTSPPEDIDPKLKGKAPFIQVTVINGPPAKAAEEFSLFQEGPAPVEIKATSLKSYAEGNEPISLVLLVEGHELWMGNETYEQNPEDQYIGVFTKLPDAMSVLSKLGPPGSLGALIVYNTSAEVKSPMADLASLTGDKLGSQKDYQGKTTRNFVAGLNLSLSELSKTTTKRRALVVIGDGADTMGDGARGEIAGLKKRLVEAGVELYVVYFAISPDQAPPAPALLKILDDSLPTATTMDDIKTKVEAIATTIQNERYYLRFPGYDDTLKAGFTWDGKPHDLILRAGGNDVSPEPVSVMLAPRWSLDTGGGFPWWLLIVIPLLLVVLVVVGIKVLGKKEEIIPQAAPPPPPPPAPMGSPKTIMMGGILGDDGPPIVGWIVPLNGPNQFQTFKLQPGVTKVGTGGPVHIVINDGFMSTEHAQFVMSPLGFVVQDGGSTNGVYVNERRIDKHELVDNDVITMGKTTFKFKTTL